MTDTIDDLYHEAMLEEVKNPFHSGQMSDADLVLHGTNASCGDVVSIYLQFENPTDKTSPIKEITWQGTGCVISRAGVSTLARLISQQKLTLPQASQLTQEIMEKELGLENISVNRIKCLLLAVNTLKRKR